jgi:hypothetical protein
VSPPWLSSIVEKIGGKIDATVETTAGKIEGMIAETIAETVIEETTVIEEDLALALVEEGNSCLARNQKGERKSQDGTQDLKQHLLYHRCPFPSRKSLRRKN